MRIEAELRAKSKTELKKGNLFNSFFLLSIRERNHNVGAIKGLMEGITEAQFLQERPQL